MFRTFLRLGFLLLAFLGGIDVAYSEMNGFFTDVMNVGSGVNGPNDDNNSSISPDGLTFYFESNRPGGFGDDDFFMARRNSTDEPFGEAMHLEEISSPFFDRSPRISSDGLRLYFISNRPLNGTTNIWLATRSRVADEAGNPEPFSEPIPVDEVNSSFHEAGPFLSFDELTLYFISNRDGGHGDFNWDIWKATRSQVVDEMGSRVPFGEPTVLEGEVNTTYHELSPHTTADELALFYSDWPNNPPYRPEGLGRSDIWLAMRPDTSTQFGDVRNVGSPVNTEWNEAHPNISPDWPANGSILFFDSDRPDGFGGQDLWQAIWILRVAGDATADGFVNIDDLNSVRNNFGAAGSNDGSLDGDTYPFDGLVNIDDLNAVRNNFGAGANRAAPEPDSLALAVLAIGIMSWLQRRQCVLYTQRLADDQS